MTPALIIDGDKVRKNATRMLEHSEDAGVRLRPHVKTHKTIEIALIQTGGKPGPITVSTLAEAEFYLRYGFTDILYAVPFTLNKWQRAKSLVHQGAELILIGDEPEILDSILRLAHVDGVNIQIAIEIDHGYNRTGLEPDDPDLKKMARAITDHDYATFYGLVAHSGEAYKPKPNAPKIASMAEYESLRFARRILEDEGIRVPVISGGSTPAVVQGDHWTHLDEVRPGNYVLFDLFMADHGVCSMADIAIQLQTCVVGCYPKRSEIVVDAGALAFSKDLGHPSRAGLYGYCLEYPDLELYSLSQEHGIIRVKSTFNWDNIRTGDLLHFYPNHSCLTAACFPEYHYVEKGKIRVIKPIRGW